MNAKISFAAPIDIVCFGADWHGHPSSTHHLIRSLSRSHRVLWINSLSMRTPDLGSSQDLRRLFARGKRLLAHAFPRQIEEHIWVIDPFYLPLHGAKSAQEFNKRLLGMQLRQALRRLGFSRPLVLSALPNCVDVLPALNPACTVYYCLDDYAAMPGVDGARIQLQEERLAREADLIAITGEHLRAHLEQAGTPIHYLPHGVDLRRFSPDAPTPRALELLPQGPRIGFFGALDSWLDLELIAEIAKARPDWQFPIVGPSRVGLELFEGIENIHLLGPVPFEEIPGYAAGFDVGLLPFEVDDFTAAINPLKLREYFAAGLPAVSTSLPEVARYQPLVAIADTRDDSIAAIEAMLHAPPPVERYLEAVAHESWDARAQELQRWLGASLSQPRETPSRIALAAAA